MAAKWIIAENAAGAKYCGKNFAAMQIVAEYITHRNQSEESAEKGRLPDALCGLGRFTLQSAGAKPEQEHYQERASQEQPHSDS